jgi:hypothetical protein
MHRDIVDSILVLWWVIACLGCTGKPLVHGLLEPGGTIYRESEREEFGTRTTVKVRSFEF